MEQRYFIKCLYLSGETPHQIIEKIAEWFGEEAMHRTQVYFWIGELKRGRQDLSDAPRSGRPKKDEIDIEIKSILDLHPYATIRMIASIVSCSTSTVLNHLYTMGYKNYHLRWVPHKLNANQKIQRLNMSKDLLQILGKSKENGFVDIISGDESWFIYYYQHERKWMIDTDNIPEIVVPSRFDRKTMVTIFIGIEGLVFRTVKPANKCWNSEYFINNVLMPLSRHPKIQDLKNHNQTCLIHFDNARCHTSQKVMKYLNDSPFSIVPHPPYSPDLSPCDFGLFGTMKNSFKGKSFDTEEQLLQNIDDFFDHQSENFWESIFNDWIQRCQACINANGNYF